MNEMTIAKEKSTIIYDSDCKLCQYAVKFLDTGNSNSGFEFISSSDSASDLLLSTFKVPKEMTGKSIILLEKNRVYTKSTAVIKALQNRGGLWNASVILLVIPKLVRDFVYDLVARNRKRLF